MLQKLSVDNAVLYLERGTSELLLVNPKCPSPLYIRSGREYIKTFIQAVSELETMERIEEHFPQERDLLRLLLAHQIIHLESRMKHSRLCFEHREESADGEVSRCEKMKRGKMGMSLYLLLSQSCNLGCIYCLNGRKTYQTEKKLKMPERVAVTAVEKCLTELSPGGDLEIVFFGGEPLLNWSLAKKVILHCENDLRRKFPDREWHYHLTTNLSLFPDDLIEWTKRYNITFLCDVDGPPFLHNLMRPYRNGRGSHADITRNIRRLRDEGIKVALRSTVTSHNVEHMLEISAHHKELGGAGSAYVAVNPVTSDEDVLPISMLPEPEEYVRGLLDIYCGGLWEPKDLFPMNTYIERVKGKERMSHGCGAPHGNTPVVDVAGNVYACIYLVGISRFDMGNILDGTYPQKHVVTDMLEVLNVDNIEGCKNCSWRYLCGGGCPVGRLTVSGNPNASKEVIQYTQEIACKTSRSMIEALLWKYAEESRGT